jgi:PhzF family phenazine biosynthesis protein
MDNHINKVNKIKMEYHIVHAFSKNNAGGNPAAVVINQRLAAAEKQEAARQIGFSETAFINDDNGYLQIEFFTPEKSIAYCGHATVASVNVLRQLGILSKGQYQLHTQFNPIVIDVEEENVFMHQQYPAFSPIDKIAALQTLQLPIKNVTEAIIADNGVRYLLVALNNATALYELQFDEQALYQYSADNDLIGMYAYVKQEDKILSRMFAPYYGIPEENATGMAAGLLAGWIHHQSGKTVEHLLIEQGFSPVMKERGYLNTTVRFGQPVPVVLVGGTATIKKTAAI